VELSIPGPFFDLGVQMKIIRLRNNFILVFCMLLTGCGKQNSVSQKLDDTFPGQFELEITPDADDPRLVVVRVTHFNLIQWQNLSAGQSFDECLKLFTVGEGSSEDSITQPVLGKFQVVEDVLEFRPAFPLIAGQKYRAVFDSADLPGVVQAAPDPIQKEYSVPAEETAEPPKVLAIYPTGAIVPANHLKFYIVFSEPMQQGEDIFKMFSLENKSTGKQVPRPFRHTELWSADNRRLTLWFHPGRQKAGVNLNVELGAILNEDDEYRLTISEKWLSKRGTPLGQQVTKDFRAAPKDTRQPNPETWLILIPTATTREPFRCELLEPYDWALLNSQISILDESGKIVPGKIGIGHNEMSWLYYPTKAWQPGNYRLKIGTVIEDLAGNSVSRPFAQNISEPQAKDKNTESTHVYQKFEIPAAETP